MRHKTGQTILEYTLIIIIILGVMIAMKDYVKRGIQGRWKTAADDVGDQYDPEFVNSDINYATQINAVSMVFVENATNNGVLGQWTNRLDLSNTTETKTGYTQIGN